VNPNGLIGGIQSTFWRRVAFVCLAMPLVIIGLAPVYLRVLPRTLWEAILSAGEAFGDEFSRVYHRPNALMGLASKQVWSVDWKPV